MEETDLRRLLLRCRKRRFRAGCPGDARLAAYADQRLGGADRAAVASHLAGCRSCLAQVSFLVQSAGWPAPAEVPASLLVRARKLAPAKQRTAPLHGWRWAGATAAAACLLLSVGLFITLRLRPPVEQRGNDASFIAQQHSVEEAAPHINTAAPTPDTRHAGTPAATAAARQRPAPRGPKPDRTQAPPSRRAEINTLAPALIYPRDGAALKRASAEFRWQTAADALFYEVFVVTEAGDIVLEQRTEATRLRLPADAPLTPGAKYFVWVRAYLREGKTANSSVVSFRVAE